MRILHVEDQEMIRELVAGRLREEPDMEVVDGAATGRQALARFRSSKPDITLTDLELEDAEGWDGEDLIREILSESPDARIIVLSRRCGIERIRYAMEAGAHSFVPVGVEFRVLLEVIRSVHAGTPLVPPQLLSIAAAVPKENWLTRREYQVLRLMQTLRTQEEVGSSLIPPIAENSVKAYAQDIYKKTKTNNPNDAIKVALFGPSALAKTEGPLSPLLSLLSRLGILRRR